MAHREAESLFEAWALLRNDERAHDAEWTPLQENREVLKKAEIDHHIAIHGLRRTMTDLLRLADVDRVTAAALIGHDTDRMQRHYSTVRLARCE